MTTKATDFRADRSLERAPEFAKALGDLSVAWSQLEFQMSVVFFALCGAPAALARTIFYSIKATRMRVEMLRAVAAVLLGEGNPTFSELYDLLDRIHKTSLRRNDFIHDTWFVAQTDKREVLQPRLSGKKVASELEAIHLHDLTQLTSQIDEHRRNLSSVHAKIEACAPALLETLRKRPVLDLAYAKRGTPRERRPKGPEPLRKD
jgi:hypothetical protein